MQSICREINNFIESISQKEIEKNPMLKGKLIALLKCLDRVNDFPKQRRSKHQGVLKYLNEKMLR